jgi:hypothetical protein
MKLALTFFSCGDDEQLYAAALVVFWPSFLQGPGLRAGSLPSLTARRA